MPRQLLAPADDTASRALTDTQTAVTKVKELVTEGVSKGWAEEEITKKLNTVIAEACKRIDNIGLCEQIRRALVTAARKWHYELKMTYRVLDTNLAQQAQRQPLGIDVKDLLKKTPYEKMTEFRRVLDAGTSPGIPIIKDYQQSVKLAMKAMSADPPKIYTGSGKFVPIRLRAEMAVRYAAAVENLQSLIDSGVKFCWISSHASCSPRCAPFQGRLYSLFQGQATVCGIEYGERGTIDGIPYRPINEALAGVNGDGNGCISGYNCRHRAVEYRRGDRPPQDYTEAQLKREYAVDQCQRAYENHIRQLKTEERQLRAAGMAKEASELRKKWRRLTMDYQIYSIEHERAYYPYRCVIDSAELQSNTEENLTRIVENGTIKANEWANDLPPRGQIDLPKGVSKSGFIQRELKVDKQTAERYQDAIEKYTGSAYSEIRAYQRGEKEGATEDYKEYLQGLSDSLETYIKRAPRWNGGETFRGVGLTDEQLETFTVGSEHDMLGVSSWSSEARIAIGRANDMAYYGASKAVVFHCMTQNKGTAIHHLSSAGGEAGEYEVLVSMEARFKVIKSSEEVRIIHIYLEEK